MSPRAVVLAVVLASLMRIAVGAATTALVVKRGPAGGRGATGPSGPRGPEGGTSIEGASDVQSAIDEDPDAVAASLSGHLDYEDIQQNLDPDPADVESELQDVETIGARRALASSPATANDPRHRAADQS